MAIYPRAKYRPLNQFSTRGVMPRVGIILHVNDSNGPSLFNWIAGDNNMSCHWQIPKNSKYPVEQYVDTNNGAWCQEKGNRTYLSVETEGYPNEPLSPYQLDELARLMVWLHATHGIPLVVAETVGMPGLGWHGMGGAAWGDHPGCPGELRKAQRTTILDNARRIIGQPSKGDDMTPEQEKKLDAVLAAVNLVYRGDKVDGPKGDTHYSLQTVNEKLDQVIQLLQRGH